MLEIGTILKGRYEIGRTIGKGGMSIVYDAYDTVLNKHWAIKELLINHEKPEKESNLTREIDLLKNLHHPALPRITDIIEYHGERLVVMDLIDGFALDKVLKQEGKLSVKRSVEYGIQLCDVLNYLHHQPKKIIYRDMKPGNVMLRNDGNLTLIDFGIAREYNEGQTSDTTLLGTRGYAAPEQYGAKTYGKKVQTDERTDIYCLGATLYHFLTGEQPPAIANLCIQDVDPTLPSGLNKVILRCTQLKQEDRYQTCDELMYALQNYQKIDTEYQDEQKRKLKIFLTAAFVCLLGFGISYAGSKGILSQTLKAYNKQLNDVNILASKSIADKQYDESVAQGYLKAIEIAPFEENAFVRLIDYHSRLTQTQHGLDAVVSVIDSDKQAADNDEVLMYVARMYFNGNPNDSTFQQDYASAAKYFNMVSKRKIPEAKYYASLALSLSELSDSIDWKKIYEDLLEFESYNDKLKKSETQIQNYLSLASVYIANKSYLRQTQEEIDPYTKSIDILVKAEATLNFMQDSSLEDTYRVDILRRKADAYYLKAVSLGESEAKIYYDQSITAYEELIPYLEIDDQKREIQVLIADIYKFQGDYQKAAEKYEQTMKNYPESSYAYSSYGLMELINRSNLSKAVSLYRQAEKLDTASKDTNFNILKSKLQNAKAI